MKNAVILFITGFVLYACSSCKKEISSLKELHEFICNPENGYRVSRSVNGVKITVMYTPPEYVAMRKAEALHLPGTVSYDSLLRDARQSAAFLMIFAPDEKAGNTNDIMYDGVSNFKEYTQRALTLNFDMESCVELHANEKIYVPALSTLENTYGLSKDRKVNLVFAPTQHADELTHAGDLDFTYADATFGTGVLHFYFDKKKIEQHLPVVHIH